MVDFSRRYGVPRSTEERRARHAATYGAGAALPVRGARLRMQTDTATYVWLGLGLIALLVVGWAATRR